MRVESLELVALEPFAPRELQFSRADESSDLSEVHLLTGENGTGKTRLLTVLAAALGNDEPLQQRIGEFAHSVLEHGNSDFSHKLKANLSRFCNVKVHSPPNTGMALAYRGSANLRDASLDPMKPVVLGERKDHLTFEGAREETRIVCQSLANLKLEAAMDHLRNETQSHAIRLTRTLEAVLSEVTGRSFAFEVTPYPAVSLKVHWGAQRMSLMQLPDGLRSIIGWLGSCVGKIAATYPNSADPLSIPLVLLLDEPETHLHPAWQRKVIPAAQKLFPNAQLFVATHSPFVISSVNVGSVYVFRADANGLVTIDGPRPCSQGDSYIDAVEDVLGVREWYDPETEALLSRYRDLRGSVLRGAAPLDELKELALTIAQRSRSLDEMMGREMRQIVRALQPQEATQ